MEIPSEVEIAEKQSMELMRAQKELKDKDTEVRNLTSALACRIDVKHQIKA